jgi:hypothetical protein
MVACLFFVFYCVAVPPPLPYPVFYPPLPYVGSAVAVSGSGASASASSSSSSAVSVSSGWRR